MNVKEKSIIMNFGAEVAAERLNLNRLNELNQTIPALIVSLYVLIKGPDFRLL